MEYISTSALANELDIKSADLFDKLKTLGWIERKNDKWVLTELGKQKGGQTRNNPKFGEFVVWPANYPFDGGGTMFDMTETGEPTATTIQDEVNAYTLSEIFAALPTSITSVQGFHALVLSQNSNKQQTAVDLLFTSYGF